MVADHQPHFLCATEHWLTSETISLFVPQGYKLVSSSCRSTGEHGGAAVYARLDVECTPADNITKMSKVPYLECAAVETVIENEPYIIVSLYRPSNYAKDNMVMFFNLLYSICDFIFMKSAKPLLAGDFNIDILKDSTFKENFTSVLNEYDLKTTVNEATRMTSNTSTCIDNIIIPSALQYPFKILPSHYSDHTMQILEIFVSVPQPKYVYRRNYSDENLTNFLRELSEETWQDVLSEKCLNDKWNIFISIFTNIFNLHFPYVKVNVNKPVHTYYEKSFETEECKRKLDIYYILARYFPEAKVHYKTLKNQYVKLLQKSKSELIKSKIDSADNKSQAMWQIVNKLTGRNNPSKIFPEGDLQSNADAINNFFINHAKNSQNSNNKHIYDENQRLKSIF
nr:unnamed protein product [Callosobruchus analis]